MTNALNRTVRLLRITVWMICLGSATFVSNLEAQDLQAQEQQAVRAAIGSVADSVVQIETLGGLEMVEGMLTSSAPTTGLIVAADGWIVSSAFNFVQQPASILVTLPGGERKPARIVARDRSRMLVLLKVETEKELPTPVPVARDQLRVGQTAIALGRTFDPAQVNLSVGIISATQRIWGKAVQTDANISPVNYGGPLVDLYGRVIGILVPLSPESDGELAGNEWYDSGIGFAVPLTDILARLETLQAGTDLKAGLMGFAFENSQQLDAAPVLGVVKSKSPAASAGLRPGDRFVSLNDVPITLQSHAMHVLKPLYAGDEVQIVADRAGETIRGRAVLVDQLLPYEHAYLGLGPGRRAGDAPNDRPPGIFVREVPVGSPAAQAGVQAGDRLVEWNDTTLTDADQLRTLLANHEPGDQATITWLQADAPDNNDNRMSAMVTLDRRPQSLDSSEATVAEEPVDAKANPPVPADVEKGQLEWKVPEEPNNGAAFIPPNYTGDRTWGLLVLIGPPSADDLAKVIEPWKDVCQQNELILIVAQPEDPARWAPTEVAFVRKAIDQAQRRFAIDPQRVTVLGQEGGGGLAYLVAFRHRDVIRGLIIDRAAIPFGLSVPDNEPLQKLSLLIHQTTDAKLKERVDASIAALQKRKFHVTTVDRSSTDASLTAEERNRLARWINTLDRL
jgi:serine protease Do